MIKYQEEGFGPALYEELYPLLEKHYEEVAVFQEYIKLNPDQEFYQMAQDTGRLHILTVRDQGKLIGYTVTMVSKNPHYSDHVYAVNDVVYVDPEYRGGEVAPEMISKLEEIMEEKGVSVMTFHMKTFKPFQSLMYMMGFEDTERVYYKYIGQD